MKKLFAVMLVAAAMTSCTDNTKTEESTRSADSVSVAPAPCSTGYYSRCEHGHY